MTLESNLRILRIIPLLPIVVLLCSSANGKIIYVDDDAVGSNDGSSWADAYNYLQDALADAESAEKPVEIRVAGGVYRPDDDTVNPNGTNNRLDTFHLINEVCLKGGFAGLNKSDPNRKDIHSYKTILSGDLAGDDISWDELLEIRADHNYSFNEPNRQDNAYHVVIGSGTDETAAIDGFTISGGRDYFDSRGGGMYIDAGNPTITNCTFTRNSAFDFGGGLYCGNNSNPTLTNCIFSRNWSLYCGGMYNFNSSPSLTNCTFTENFAEIPGGVIVELGYMGCGGMRNSQSNPTLINCSFIENLDVGIHNNNSNPTLIKCTFRGNMGFRGGGIANYDSSPTLTNCIFIGNTAEYGGGMRNYQSSPILTNCIFTGNKAGTGGAITGGSPTLINCTIAGNIASRQGAISSGSPTILNCIIWDNTIPQIVADATVSFSNIQCGWPGEGNIDTDPLFIDADGQDNILGTEDDDLRLFLGSPCIDSGDNSAVPSSVVADMNGNQRIINEITDMGAYESPINNLVLSIKTLAVPEAGTSTFTVALVSPPQNAVEVTVDYYSGDQDIKVESGELLKFNNSNYSIPQIVVLAALEDDDNLNSKSRIRITTATGSIAIVTATEVDNELDAGILFVDDDAVGKNNGANWADAFVSLQEALSAAVLSEGIEEIRVAQGIYTPYQGLVSSPDFDNRQVTFLLIKGVALKGGYAGASEPEPDVRDIDRYETILSGDLNGDDIKIANTRDLWDEPSRDDNSYHVVTASGTDETTLFDGFTITGGNAANGFNLAHWYGGGLSSEYGSLTVANCTFRRNRAFSGAGMDSTGRDSTITNCKFIGNYVDSRGAGIYIGGCSPTMNNCTFNDNFALHYGGGGVYNYNSSASFSNCLFEGNSTAGGGAGICNVNSSPTLSNCLFIRNLADDVYYAYGGGMFNEGSSPTINNCMFSDNSALQGGAIGNESSSPSFINCIFSGNKSTWGGGIHSSESQLTLTNCTFALNSAILGNAIVCDSEPYNRPSFIRLFNCIVWDEGDEIWNNDTSILTILYCDIWGGFTGEGNINVNPLFADPGSKDFHLKSQAGRWDQHSQSWIVNDVTSPCIDAGDQNSLIGYEPFPNGGIINMGAYGGTSEASKSP